MKEYIVYQCMNCKKHFILLVGEVDHTEKEAKYITCPFHGMHKDIRVVGSLDGLQEQIKSMSRKDTYTKRSGKTVQKGWD